MSWDSYIDNLIAQSKDASGEQHVDQACVFGIDGGSMWTTEQHGDALKISPGESAAISKCFKNRDFTDLQANGIHINGVKYQFLREEEGKLVLGKKKDHGAITMQASKTAIVSAHIPEGKQQGNGNKAVAIIAEYLESMNM